MSQLNELINPQFDILEVGSIDTSVSNTIFRKYEPDVSLTATTTSININVRDLREYINLANSYIEIQGHYSGSATAFNTVVVDTARPALECGITSLFNQSRLRINQVLVEDNFSTSHHNAHIKQLLMQSKDFNESIGRNSGFIPDKATGLAVELETSFTTLNKGYCERRVDATGQFGVSPNNVANPTTIVRKSFVIRLSDLFSFCSVNKVIKGTTLRIELNLRSAVERMFSGAIGAYYLVQNCNLWLAVVEPSLELQAKLEGALSSPISIPYSYVNWKTYSSDTNNSTVRSFTFSIQSQKPMCCFVYAQRSPVVGTAEDLYNSMVYDSAQTNFVQMRCNNKLYPYQPYEPSFGQASNGVSTTGSFVSREYEELVKYMSKNYNTDSGAMITPKEWEGVYPIYYIPFYSLPDATSYQLTLDTKASIALNADYNVRGQTVTWYLTLCSLAEVQVKSDGQGMQIYAM
jgi:hypothetical protein